VARLGHFLLSAPPAAGEHRHSVIRPTVTELHQVNVELLEMTLFLGPSARLVLQPRGQHLCFVIELTRALPPRVSRLQLAVPQVLTDGITRQLYPLAISRIDTPSCNCQRQITLNIATSITPSLSCSYTGQEGSTRGSKFNANIYLKWTAFGRNSTLMEEAAESIAGL